MAADLAKEHVIAPVSENYEVSCWACGLRLLLPSHSPIFKCGWCGAITNQNSRKSDRKYFWLRRMRDRFFVGVLLAFMLFVICGGVWAVHPFVFSSSYYLGVFHSIITSILSVSTIYNFSSAAFRSAGIPPVVVWGSYPAVGKGHLENYTFCHVCSKPKSPRSHHCRSCGQCVMDMDHHCPFIGNCVGASNHRHFIAFLISAVLSMLYVSFMCIHVGLSIWPSLTYQHSGQLNGHGINLAFGTIREVSLALFRSAVLLSARGLVLVYLLVSSVSVEVGLSILLWQQLSYIYEGQTYVSHLSSHDNHGDGNKDCQNLLRFFGCSNSYSRFLPFFKKKIHKK